MFAQDLAKLMLLQRGGGGSSVGAFSPPAARLRLHVQSSLILDAPWGFPALIEINIGDSPGGLVHMGLVYGNMHWKVD